MISVEGLRKSIRNGSRTVDILKGLDFAVPQGQFAAVMGASGSGKSTLLGLLAGPEFFIELAAIESRHSIVAEDEIGRIIHDFQ